MTQHDHNFKLNRTYHNVQMVARQKLAKERLNRK